jgi:hypothetical protein
MTKEKMCRCCCCFISLCELLTDLQSGYFVSLSCFDSLRRSISLPLIFWQKPRTAHGKV